MKAAILVFPGSNCDQDALHACRDVMGWDTRMAWHDDELPAGLDLVIVPGGFTYGDYLRCGALAAHSPVMDDVRDFAARGGLVLGICNGFQILCEAGLLPGVLVRNTSRRFRCMTARLGTANRDTAFTSRCPATMRIPIAHGMGNYQADAATLAGIEARGQVLFRYVDDEGRATPEANPNGSANNIAGIMDATGCVAALMPHPERAIESPLGGDDGRAMFESLAVAVAGGAVRR